MIVLDCPPSLPPVSFCSFVKQKSNLFWSTKTIKVLFKDILKDMNYIYNQQEVFDKTEAQSYPRAEVPKHFLIAYPIPDMLMGYAGIWYKFYI